MARAEIISARSGNRGTVVLRTECLLEKRNKRKNDQSTFPGVRVKDWSTPFKLVLSEERNWGSEGREWEFQSCKGESKSLAKKIIRSYWSRSSAVRGRGIWLGSFVFHRCLVQKEKREEQFCLASPHHPPQRKHSCQNQSGLVRGERRERRKKEIWRQRQLLPLFLFRMFFSFLLQVFAWRQTNKKKGSASKYGKDSRINLIIKY